jgi:hypothetical protein
MDLWRVQSTWTVGDEERSYRPLFVETEAEAIEVRDEMEETLSHFPTLDVLVARVTEAERASELAVLGESEEVQEDMDKHLMPHVGARRTACGVLTSEVAVSAVAEYFDLSARESHCPACQAARDAAAS